MRLGLVLSGGTAKGAFQLGALKALQKVFPPESFTCISASSIGIMNAYSFATNQMEEAEYIWTHLPFTKLSGFVKYIRRDSYFEEVFAPLKMQKPVCPCFYSLYFQLAGRTTHYVNLAEKDPGEYMDYLKAGVAIPPFCRPVIVHGEKCIDGALIDNIPVTPIEHLNCDYIIAIYFDKENYSFISPEFNQKVLRLNMQDHGFVWETFAFDQAQIRSMMDEGQKACEEKLKIWEPIIRSEKPVSDAALNPNETQSKTWYTADMLLNRINQAARKLTRYQMDRGGNSLEHDRLP